MGVAERGGACLAEARSAKAGLPAGAAKRGGACLAEARNAKAGLARRSREARRRVTMPR